VKTSCTHCGTPHTLNDEKIRGFPRVQFRCTKCGRTSTVEVTRQPERTQVISPLPDFARSGPAGPALDFASDVQGLALPADHTVVLSVIDGPSKGLQHALSKPRIVIGRAGADLEIQDPEISRWHCAIEVKNEIVSLRDLESTNGTFVGEERVRAAQLGHLSEFRIGASVILVTLTPKPAR
jgi:pSer/pThr/pTyr-binding forkhead associated (FHA) protein